MTVPAPTLTGLRVWQRAALDAYVAKADGDFLVTATPGSGKTTFALTVAADLLHRRVVHRVIVVAPTDHLRTQWTEAANQMGINLDPTLANDRAMTADFHGCVVTYAQVALRPLVHRSRCETRATLVILDEVHHAGDGLSWGEAVREAFEPAKRRLSMTGTPFRTKEGETIPFVHYEPESDGSKISHADYTYGYKEALTDHVVRPVMFAAYSGVSRWRNNAGQVLSANLSEELSKADEMSAWRTALNPAGQWIPHVIAAADQRLTEVRAAGMPDAAGMMLASDQDTARAYADIMEKVTGVKPVLVLSDDPKASLKIAQFTTSHDKWLIAVRMVSEGVDIPRAAVGLWATSYRTPLFFAQAIGRFVRARKRGESATVFLPAVRPLLALAAEMELERNHVIAPPATAEEGALDGYEQLEFPPARDENQFEALDAEAQFAHVLFNGRAVTGNESNADLTEDESDYLGLPGLLDSQQMATLLRRREDQTRLSLAGTKTSEFTPAQVQARHKQTQAVRKEISSLVGRYAAKSGLPHAKIHAMLRRRVPGPPAPSAPLEILAARRDHLLTKV
ncbi:DEAD/DEAH box helicase [Tessaracoccus sp.]